MDSPEQRRKWIEEQVRKTAAGQEFEAVSEAIARTDRSMSEVLAAIESVLGRRPELSGCRARIGHLEVEFTRDGVFKSLKTVGTGVEIGEARNNLA